MSRIHKCLAVLLAVIMVICLAACGRGGSEEETESTRRRTREARTEEEAAEGSEETERTRPRTSEAEEDTAEAPSRTREARSSEPETEEPSETSSEAGHGYTGDPVTLRIGLSEYMPRELELWEDIAGRLADDGITLEVVAVKPDSEDFKDPFGHGYDLDLGGASRGNPDFLDNVIAYTFSYNKWNLYSSAYGSVEEIADGTVIAIPSMNLPYMLQILEDAGIIRLKGDLTPVLYTMDDEFQPYLEEHIDEYLIDVTFEMSNMVMPLATALTYDTFVMTDSDVRMLQFDEEFKGRVGSVDLLFEDPLTDREYYSTLKANPVLLEDPAMLDALEAVVDAFQSEETLEFFRKKNYAAYPVGWDIDMLSRFR